MKERKKEKNKHKANTKKEKLILQVVQDLSKEEKTKETFCLVILLIIQSLILRPTPTGATFCLTNYRNFMLQMGQEIRKFHILQKRKSDKMKSD